MRDQPMRATSMRDRKSWTAALALYGIVAIGCALPPVLTPQRIADRGPAPLARTAEVRISPTVYFEQRPFPSEDGTAHLEFEANDIATRPNVFAAFAFTDSLTMVLPLGVLWSPLVQAERGFWLTVGGGVYGFGVSGGDVQLTDAVGVWAKRRLGSDFWVMGGLAVWHTFDNTAADDEYAPRDNYLGFIPGVETGVQVIDAWAVAFLVDYQYDLIDGGPGYSRLRIEHVLVPIWWIDIGVHGGIYLHAREDLHADPLVGFTVTGRW